VLGKNKVGEVSGFPMENFMYFKDGEVDADGSPQKPEIRWDKYEKYAIIAFLLKSIDENADKDNLVRFNNWVELNVEAIDPFECFTEEEEKEKARDTVISECEKFLATLDADSRYDCIAEECSRFIESGDFYDSTCVIGSSYNSNDVMHSFGCNDCRLVGTAETLLRFFEFVIDDTDYDGNKRRLLKHIARKWNLANNVFSDIENGVKELSLIKKERDEAKASSKPYSEVVEILADLDAREKAVWEQLEKFDIPNPNGKAETTLIPPVLR
jgi:hypothetical protein